MQTLVNGLPKNEISIMDRGLLYGDGAFETLLVINGRVTLFDQHLDRLARACQFLKLKFSAVKITEELTQLCQHSSGRLVAKIIITRGAGGRGYAPNSDTDGCRIIQLFDQQGELTQQNEKGISATICQHRLSQSDSLAGIKHLNRLDQVLASADLKAQFDEGLCLDRDDYVIEGTKSNILIRCGGQLLTPDLSTSGVQGIMLAEIKLRFQRQGNEVITKKLTVDDVFKADELLFCNSVLGVSPVIKLCGNGRVKHSSIGEFCQQALRFKDEILASH